MTGNSSFDQKNQSVKTQANFGHVDKVIIQPSDSALPLPQQIPSPPFDFTGREEEIKSLLDQFDQGATITGLRGLGGIGKTALALVLADRLKGLFPDSQLFLNMLGTSKNPLTPEEAMAHIIRSYLGFDVKLPADKNGLGGHYRSVLSGKRALILLDNAASREQVEPLLPPAGSALLVTSRSKFTLPGLTEKDLDVLPLEDAKKLLQEIAGRIGEHAGELAKLCGCLPMALRNAASVLREKPNLSVANYIKRLEDARKRLELVEASFSSSYDLLTPKLQRLWSLLSVFPADFDQAGAAAVWEMENDATEDALGELVMWSLVDFLPSAAGEEGRYKLHDLARDFAASRLDPSVLDLFQRSHAEHYRSVLSVADKIFNQGNENYLDGLKLFDIELINIQAGQYWAEKNLAVNSFAERLCMAYPDAGANLLDLRLNPQQEISWLETGLKAARHLMDRNIECNLLGNLGLVFFVMGDARKAIKYHEQALTIAREFKDRREEGTYLGNLGLAYSALGDTRKAIEYHEQALSIAREFKDRRKEGTNLGNLGMNFAIQGDVQKAIEHHKLHMAIAHDIGDRRGERDSLGNLGNAYAEIGNYFEAIKYYERVLAIDREIGDRQREGSDLGNLGIAYKNLDDPNNAIKYHEQHLSIARDIGDRRGEGNALGNLGNAHYAHGDVNKALGYYKQVLTIERIIGDKREEGRVLGSLGAAYHQLGYAKEALKYYEQHLIIAREIGDKMGEGSTLFNMSICLDDLGQRHEAIKRAISALAILEPIKSRHAETVRKALAQWMS